MTKGCICDKRVPMCKKGAYVKKGAYEKKGAYVKKGCICTSREGSDVRGWFICPRESSNVTEGFKC